MSLSDYTLTPGIGLDGKPAFSFSDPNFDDLITPFESFPLDCLPADAKEFVEQGALAVDCDPAMVALPLISCMASCIGSARRLQVKSTWIEPAILWTCVVAKSGSAKSPAAALVIDIMKEIADERESEQVTLIKSLGETSNPSDFRIITTNGTVPGVASILHVNPKGLLYHADELAGWLKDQGKYSSNKSDDSDAWNELYDGKSFWHDRKVAKSLRARFPNICITGGIQPDRLFRILSQDNLDSGLAARILFCMPPSRKRKLTDNDLDSSVRDKIKDRLKNLLKLDPGYSNSQWTPKLLALSEHAFELFRGFYDHHQIKVVESDGALNAALSKLGGVALRLALTIELFANPESTKLSVNSMQNAIEMTEWLVRETERVYSIRAQSPEDRLAAIILDVLAEKGKSTVRQIQRSRHALKRSGITVESIEKQLSRLKNAGHVNCTEKQTGGRPAWLWFLTSKDEFVTIEV